jgi:hypothetical protein
MNKDLEKTRKAQERGDVLRTLAEDYAAEMTSVRTLIGTMDVMGIPLERSDLEAHLVYLAQQGLVELWRARDMPSFRTDRENGISPHALLFAKLSAKGLQLITGVAEADSMVIF